MRDDSQQNLKMVTPKPFQTLSKLESPVKRSYFSYKQAYEFSFLGKVKKAQFEIKVVGTRKVT